MNYHLIQHYTWMNLKADDEKKKPNKQIRIHLFLHVYKSNRPSYCTVLEAGEVVTFGGILTGREHEGSYLNMVCGPLVLTECKKLQGLMHFM